MPKKLRWGEVERVCLKCRNKFWSASKTNRLCGKCNTLNSTANRYLSMDTGSTDRHHKTRHIPSDSFRDEKGES